MYACLVRDDKCCYNLYIYHIPLKGIFEFYRKRAFTWYVNMHGSDHFRLKKSHK